MCGIVGYFGSSAVGLTHVLSGMAAILYRAPDSTGAAWFGDHREGVRIRKAVGSLSSFVEALLIEGVYPDRAESLRRLWQLPSDSPPGGTGKPDTTQEPDPGDVTKAQTALLRWEELACSETKASAALAYDDLLEPGEAHEPMARPGTRGRASDLPVFRVTGEGELVALVERLAGEFDLSPVVSRILIRRALLESLASRKGKGLIGVSQATVLDAFDALFERVVSARLFYPPTSAPHQIEPPGTASAAAPMAEQRIWKLLQAVEIRVPRDFDRDGVRNLFRLLDGLVLARIQVDSELDKAVQESFVQSWPQSRTKKPSDWLTVYQAEKAVNVFGRAAAAAWTALRRISAAPGPEPEALGYFSSPLIAHGRWALQSPVTVRNAHPFWDTEGKRAVVLNGQFSAEVEKELKEFLSQAGFRFRSENSSEYLALLWGYYFDVLCAEQRRAETIRAHVDGGLEGYSLGSQSIDYRVYALLKGKSEVELDEMAFIAAARRILQRGGQAAIAGQSLYSPRRLYVASHNRPLFLVRRRDAQAVMVVSDVNAALGLFRQIEILQSFRRLRVLQERRARETAELKASGAAGAALQQARELFRQQEQELLQQFRLKVLPLEGGENFARIESVTDGERAQTRIRISDFDGNSRPDLEVLDLLINPLEAAREVFTSFYETHLREVPDALRDVLGIAFAEGDLGPRLPLNRRLLHKRFGGRLETLKRVVFVGMGGSYKISQIARRTILSFLPDRETIAVLPAESEQVLQSVDPEKDLVVCLSWTGTTADTVEFAAELLRSKVVFVAVTNKPYSDLGLLAWKSLGVINLMSGEELTVAAVKSPLSLLFGVCLLGAWLAGAVGQDGIARELTRSLHEIPDRIQQVLDDSVLHADAHNLARAASSCRYALIVDDFRGFAAGVHGAHALAEAGEGMVVNVLDYRDLRVSPLIGRGKDLLVVVNVDGGAGEALECMKRLFLADVPFTAMGAQPGVLTGAEPGVFAGAQPGVLTGAQPGSTDAATFYSRGRRLRLPGFQGIHRPFAELTAFILFALQLAQAQGRSVPGFPRNRVKSVTAGRSRPSHPASPGAELELLNGRERDGQLHTIRSDEAAGKTTVYSRGSAADSSSTTRPSPWERAGSFEWERASYRRIRSIGRLASGEDPVRSLFVHLPELGSPIYTALAEGLSEGSELLFACLDRQALAAGASAADLWSRLSGAHVRAERWERSVASGLVVASAPGRRSPELGDDRLVCVLATNPPDSESRFGPEDLAAALSEPSGRPGWCWIGPGGTDWLPGSGAISDSNGPPLFVLGPQATEAGAEGLYLALTALLSEIWRSRAPAKAEAVRRLLGRTHEAVETVLGDQALKKSIAAVLEANRGCKTAYYVGPSRGRCFNWTFRFERPAALLLSSHLYGEGAHGPLAAVDPRPESKYVALEPRDDMTARFGSEQVEEWERRFLEPGVTLDDLARPQLESSPSAAGGRPQEEPFFAQGSWYLPVLRAEADASRDALIVLDATSSRRYRQALDELAVYGCRFARLVVLSQSGFGPGGDPKKSAEFPLPFVLYLPAIGGSAPIPDGLLPVVTGLLATAFAAASCRAAAAPEAQESGLAGTEPRPGAEAEILVHRAFGLIGEALLRSGISLRALDHAQVAALRSLAPLVTAIRRSARFEVRRIRSAADLERMGRHGRIRGLTQAGWEAFRKTSAGVKQPSFGELFLLRSESGSRNSPWTVAYGTAWEALTSGDVAIGERLDGTPLLEMPLFEATGETGHLYRFTVRYLEWDHGSPLEAQLQATIAAMQKGLPSLNRQSPGYLALAGGVREALRDSVDSPSQQTEGPWHDWLLTLVPRSWLLRKPSLELARLLAARARKLLEYPRGAGIETSASAALAAAGSALEKLWSELKVVDSGNDDERWPLLEDKLSGQLSGELEERLRQKPHPPNRKGTRNTRPGKLQQKTPSRTGRTRSRHDTHGGRK